MSYGHYIRNNWMPLAMIATIAVLLGTGLVLDFSYRDMYHAFAEKRFKERMQACRDIGMVPKVKFQKLYGKSYMVAEGCVPVPAEGGEQ